MPIPQSYRGELGLICRRLAGVCHEFPLAAEVPAEDTARDTAGSALTNAHGRDDLRLTLDASAAKLTG